MNLFGKLDHIESIEEQGFKTHVVPNRMLVGSGNDKFNGSMVEFRGSALMAYRARDKNNEDRYNIAIARLQGPWEKGGLSVLESRFLNLVGECDDRIFEDPRLFVFRDKLWLSYCEVILPHDRKGNPIYNRLQIPIHLVRLDENWNVEHHVKIRYGLNFAEPKAVEKNWTFFEYNKKLHFCYGGKKHPVIRVDEGNGNIIQEFDNQEINWPHGHFRGGTPPMLDDGSFLCFIHNSTDHRWLERRYTLSMYRFRPLPGFDIISASKVPLIYGNGREPYCGRGNGRCVFPMGVVKKSGIFYVSCGINDTCNYIIEIPEQTVEDNLVPIKYYIDEDPWTYFEGPASMPFLTSWGRETPWSVWKTSGKEQHLGVYRTADPYAIRVLRGLPEVTELTRLEYYARVSSQVRIDNKHSTPPILSGRGGRSLAG